MTRTFETQLDEIKDSLLRMASHDARSLSLAMRSLVERNDALADEVERGDTEIDTIEVELDEAVVQFLARNGPVAADLRFVVVASKISTNLERIGDGAVSIARIAKRLNREPELPPVPQVQHMAAHATEMLKTVTDAFVAHDDSGMTALIQRDVEVDRMNREVQEFMCEAMRSNPDRVACCVQMLLAARVLERVADHCKAIAEQIIFLVKARDVRHHHAA